MMSIKTVTDFLETIAPRALQESYDNAGLLTGNPDWPCQAILCCLDVTEEVVAEAVEKKCNLIVAHHPIIFSGLKKLTGGGYVERTIIKAIKNDIAIYAIHTNLDHVLHGVNGKIAAMLGLENISILAPKPQQLCKLYFYVPEAHEAAVTDAVFAAGAGNIGNYSECSFKTSGTGSFKPNMEANPFNGTKGERHEDKEVKVEMLFPAYLQHQVLSALKSSHPYEEVAYEIIGLNNLHQEIGAGITGEWKDAIPEISFLQKLKDVFGLSMLKHTRTTGKPIKKVSICGGAGIFLLKNALASKSDAYITSDIKYHEFFDADGQILLADIGHYESEQFTIELLSNLLEEKFPTFAVLKTGINTNPVQYF
ncbi:Nif3-like dinuclear metal center hexameric protein [Niabella insulamsoli]|uniref:Nif3-like dinuclear metal center hexameric protein n=1 Tax=Niabella insulamsoli TaxID=3144874 RepID=UPI0031FBCF81